MREDFNYLYHLCVEKLKEMEIYLHFSKTSLEDSGSPLGVYVPTCPTGEADKGKLSLIAVTH